MHIFLTRKRSPPENSDFNDTSSEWSILCTNFVNSSVCKEYLFSTEIHIERVKAGLKAIAFFFVLLIYLTLKL